MRVAITSLERLFLDGLVGLFSGSRFHVVAAGTDHRSCIRSARQEQADLFIFDLRGASDNDVQFLLGAQTFGEFRTILISDGEGLPPGFEVSVTRDDTAQALLDKAQTLGADLVRPATRGRGRPRMMTHGFELSNREYEVACLIAKGYTNQKIAETMALKEQSVKNLVSTVIRKLHCENRVQVALRLSRSNQETANA
ncbi:MAG TPA: LuxR C-terminal-related transcriptional regulator [Fimbriimonadaceae bacterium]|nr:LuxR C-terminal-related transcriptional regulator [Fimbriimonadaceae bacterium]